VLVAFSAAFGCHREPPPPPTLAIAEPAPVPGAEKIACRIGPKQTMLPLDDAGLHLRFDTARGNKVSMLGRDVVADQADVTLPDAITRIADDRAGTEWSDFEATVASPDGQNAKVKVSLHVIRPMTARLDAARGKPMLFPGEMPSPSANKLAWVHRDGVTPYVIGEGRWRDIDLIAFDTTSGILGSKTCDSVPNGWNETGVLSTHMSSHIELYDRRTGKLVDETTINGPDHCPTEHDPRFSFADSVRAWIASKLAR